MITEQKKTTFTNFGWIVEAKLKEGQREAFEAVMNDQIKESLKEEGTLNYQYYISNEGDILVYERFKDLDAAHQHIGNWDAHAERWTAAATPTRMLHLGDMPTELRDRHAVLSPLWMLPLGGFSRDTESNMIAQQGKTTFANFGWIVEAKLKEGKRAAFEAVMNDQIEESLKEEGTLNYQYYISNEGDILVYERFKDLASAHQHIGNWDAHAERWIAAATPTRMLHLGDMPAELRDRHAALSPALLLPLGGFARL